MTEPSEIATGLLLHEAALLPATRWLVLGGEAALPAGVRTAIVAADVHWLPVDSRERDAATGSVVVHDDERDVFAETAYECVLLPVPPERDLARRWLLLARQGLAPGGILLLAGANAEGVRSIIADATTLFGPPQAETYRQKHRIARFRAGAMSDPPPWADEPGIAPGTWRPFTVELDGETVALETRPGVFAGDRLDAGTRLLLDHLRVASGERVLDVGCGTGVIGIAASRRGAASIDLIDANLLAVATARHNLARLGIDGRVLASDVYSAVAGERYDLIVSNPPFHRGKRVDLSVADRLIAGAPEHLRPGGRLLLVANAFLAYDRQVRRVFRHMEVLAATRQYHVLEAREPR